MPLSIASIVRVVGSLVFAATATTAHGQWTVINLHPAGAAVSFAHGVDGGA